MSLTDKLDNVKVALVGDRVSLAAKGMIVGSVMLFATYGQLGIPFFCVGFLLGGYTNFGLGTLRYYKRTKKHIKRFGRLDTRFVEKMIGETENRKLTGYCQLQGMYLAAKEFEQLDSFYRAKKNKSNNILPNF